MLEDALAIHAGECLAPALAAAWRDVLVQVEAALLTWCVYQRLHVLDGVAFVEQVEMTPIFACEGDKWTRELEC